MSEMVNEAQVKVDALRRCDAPNAARAIGKSAGTLANWRTAGLGPRWFKVDGRVYYYFDDLVTYGRGEPAEAA